MAGSISFSIVIPAFNAASTLGQVIDELQAHYPESPIIVVDDGSSDETGMVATRSHVNLLSHARNQGSGAALKTGLAYAQGLPQPWILTIGADRQRDAGDIQALCDKTQTNPALQVVIGSKYLQSTSKIPWLRKCGGKLISWLFRSCYPHYYPLTDVLSGFRLYRRDCLSWLLAGPNGYDFEIASCCAMAQRVIPVEEVPVTVWYHSQATRMRAPLLVGMRIILRLFQKKFLSGQLGP